MMRRITQSALVAVILAMTAMHAKATSSADLQGTWRWLQTDATAEPGETPHFTIEGRTISGYDGCNFFSGELGQAGGIAASLRACAGDQPMLPLDLTDPLAHLESGTLEGGRLSLPARGAIPAAIFVHDK